MFRACIKKEVLEELRTKRFLRLTLLSIAMVMLTAIIIGVMSLISNLEITMAGQDPDMITTIMQMFEPTYYTFSMYFGAFMMTYFTIICIIMLMTTISKEISQNKWILPISAGILPKTIISAKLLVKSISILLAEIIAMIIHFIVAMILFEATATFGIGNLLLSYVGILVFSVFMSVLTMCINAISKKGWISAIIPIVLLILGTTTMESILVDGTPIIAYTPFMFYELAINPSLSLNATHWIVSSIGLIVVLSMMVVWAIFSTRVKPSNEE